MIIEWTYQFNMLVYTFIISNNEKYLSHFAVNFCDQFSFRFITSSFKEKSLWIKTKKPVEI